MVRALPLAFTIVSIGALAGCHGEELPDDPRPVASAEALVPAAAIRASLAPSASPAPVTTTPLPPGPGGAHSAPGVVRDDPPALSKPGLPPEVVRRITRQSFGRFRSCYQASLAADPTCTGSVVARYLIAADGSVGAAVDAGSMVTDPALVACVLGEIRKMSFPSPLSGALTVTQSLYFAPPAAP